MRASGHLALILTLGLLVPAGASAQSGAGNGAIEGQVVDADARPVPGVSVEIRSAETGDLRRAVTEDSDRCGGGLCKH